MDLLLLLKAALLGIVEGLTEFLPVSSTGHLIIVADRIGFTGNNAKVFEVAIQLGAILGVAWDCRARLARLVTGLHQAVERRFALNLLIAFLPAAVIGLLLHREIKQYLFNPVTVAWALIAGGIAILVIERLPIRHRISNLDAITARDALKIGLAQTLSLFPGISRAGATIMGGLIAGLNRTTATEFSFFLAMPVMVAATAFELYGNLDGMSARDLQAFAVGFIMSFITAVIVVKLFLRYVSNHDFTVFAWYRIVFGGLVLAYFR
jgi:undecaprenyl-diphosphatase